MKEKTSEMCVCVYDRETDRQKERGKIREQYYAHFCLSDSFLIKDDVVTMST